MKSELPKQILSQSLKYSAVHWGVFNIAKAKAIAMVGSLFPSHSKITLFFFSFQSFGLMQKHQELVKKREKNKRELQTKSRKLLL